MAIGHKLRKYDYSKEVDQRWYRSMIGILLYVITSRLDIMQVVGIVARFQSSPKETHLLALERNIWYLKGPLEFGLWFPRDDTFSFTTYFDVDWVGCVDYRESTSGCSFFLGNFLVSWLNKKQAYISLSTTEAEYIIEGECYTQII